MTGADPLFIDTNVLIYATNQLSPLQPAALARLKDARQQGSELIVSPQILREYFAAATRPGPSGAGAPLADVLHNLESFKTQFKVVEENLLVSGKLIDLVRTVPTAGKRIHDVNIVATMLVHGIGHLLTHNVVDFAKFAGLITVIPLVT